MMSTNELGRLPILSLSLEFFFCESEVGGEGARKIDNQNNIHITATMMTAITKRYTILLLKDIISRFHLKRSGLMLKLSWVKRRHLKEREQVQRSMVGGNIGHSGNRNKGNVVAAGDAIRRILQE